MAANPPAHRPPKRVLVEALPSRCDPQQRRGAVGSAAQPTLAIPSAEKIVYGDDTSLAGLFTPCRRTPPGQLYRSPFPTQIRGGSFLLRPGVFALTAVKEFGFCTLNPVGVSVRRLVCAAVRALRCP